MARPSSYNPDLHPKLIRWMARCGLTEAEIAASPEFGIADSTFGEWKVRHPEFSESLEQGKLLADIAVEAALLKRALGYEYEEVEVIRNDKGEIIRSKLTVKQVVGDVTAQIFWLENRLKDRWRDAKDIRLQGDKNNPMDVVFSPLKDY
jgi:hypothetical protein